MFYYFYYTVPHTPPVIFPYIVCQPLPLGVQCHWCGEFICPLNCVGQLFRFYQYQEPSWGPPAGPTQNQAGFRDAEALQLNHDTHPSTVTIPMDGYTGPHPGYTWIGAYEETGGGEV